MDKAGDSIVGAINKFSEMSGQIEALIPGLSDLRGSFESVQQGSQEAARTLNLSGEEMSRLTERIMDLANASVNAEQYSSALQAVINTGVRGGEDNIMAYTELVAELGLATGLSNEAVADFAFKAEQNMGWSLDRTSQYLSGIRGLTSEFGVSMDDQLSLFADNQGTFNSILETHGEAAAMNYMNSLLAIQAGARGTAMDSAALVGVFTSAMDNMDATGLEQFGLSFQEIESALLSGDVSGIMDQLATGAAQLAREGIPMAELNQTFASMGIPISASEMIKLADGAGEFTTAMDLVTESVDLSTGSQQNWRQEVDETLTPVEALNNKLMDFANNITIGGERLPVIIQQFELMSPALVGVSSAVSMGSTAFAGMGRMLGPVGPMLMGPLGIIAALVALAGITGNLSDEASDALGPVGDMFESFGNILDGVGGKIAGIAGGILEGVLSIIPKLPEILQPVIDTIFDFFMDNFDKVADGLVSFIVGIISMVATTLPQVINQLVPPLFSLFAQLLDTLLGMVTTLIGPLLSAVVGITSELFSSFADALPGMLGVILDAVIGVLDEVIAILPSIIMTLLDSLISVLNSVTAFLPDLITAIVGLVDDLLVAILPMLPGILQAVIDVFIDTIGSIMEYLPDLINMLSTLIMDTVAAILVILPSLVTMIVECMVDYLTTLVDFVPMLISSFWTVFEGVIWAVMAALPTLLPLLIEGLSELFGALLGQLSALIDPLFEVFGGLIEMLVVLLPDLVDILTEALVLLIGAVLDNLDVIIDVFFSIWEAVFAMIPELLAFLVSALITLFECLPNMLTQLVGALFEVVGQLFAGVFGRIPELVGGLVDSLLGLLGISDVGAALGDVWNTVKEILLTPVRIVVDGINWMIGIINSLIDWDPPVIGGGSVGNLLGIGNIGLIELAEGGIVTDAIFSLVGEAGPEAVIPLDRLGSMLGAVGGDGSETVAAIGFMGISVKNALIGLGDSLTASLLRVVGLGSEGFNILTDLTEDASDNFEDLVDILDNRRGVNAELTNMVSNLGDTNSAVENFVELLGSISGVGGSGIGSMFGSAFATGLATSFDGLPGFGTPRGGYDHTGADYQPAGVNWSLGEMVPVNAWASGEVVAMDNDPEGSYGRWVTLLHDSGLYSMYAHLAEIPEDLELFDMIPKGGLLGILGGEAGNMWTGSGAGLPIDPHVHVEIGTGLRGGGGLTGTLNPEEFRSGLQHLAQGGIVTRQVLATVGEGGPEAVIPLDRLENLLTANGNLGSASVVAAIARERDDLIDILKDIKREIKKSGGSIATPLEARVRARR